MIFRRFPATQSAIVPDLLLIIPRVLPTRAPRSSCPIHRVGGGIWGEKKGKKKEFDDACNWTDTRKYKNKMLHRSSILRISLVIIEFLL